MVAGVGVGAFALLVGIALTTGDDGSPAAIRLVWPDPPDGIELLDADDVTLVDDGPGVSQGLLFGAGTDDDPFADGDLLLATFDGGEIEDLDGLGDPITVRGHAGAAVAPQGPNVPASIIWAENESLSVMLASRSYDTLQLIDIAESLTFDGHLASLADTDGLDLLVDNDLLAFGSYSVGAKRSIVSYGRTDDESTSVTVRAAPGDPSGLLGARYFAGGGEPVTVRGEQGWLVADDEDAGFGFDGNAVVWLADGVIFTVRTTGDLDPAALAEQLEGIDDKAWRKLVDEFGQP